MSVLKSALLLGGGLVAGVGVALSAINYVNKKKVSKLTIDTKPLDKPAGEGVTFFNADLEEVCDGWVKVALCRKLELMTRRIDNGDVYIELADYSGADKGYVSYLSEDHARDLVKAAGYNPGNFTYETTRMGWLAKVTPDAWNNVEPAPVKFEPAPVEIVPANEAEVKEAKK